MVQGFAAFQGEKGHIFFTHEIRHISGGHAHPFAKGIIALIDEVVEDFHAQMAHGNIIGIREAESEGGVHLFPVFFHGIHFAANIACRLLHLLQQLFQPHHFLLVQGGCLLYKNSYKTTLYNTIILLFCL